MMLVGAGVLAGRIASGWGFPLSPVPNWGRPWGAVLFLAGAVCVTGPIIYWFKPPLGWRIMLGISVGSLLVGTPVIQSVAEIVSNLGRTTPTWSPSVDSVWALWMMLHVAILLTLCGSSDRDSEWWDSKWNVERAGVGRGLSTRPQRSGE
jgi:hypothetical protein